MLTHEAEVERTYVLLPRRDLAPKQSAWRTRHVRVARTSQTKLYYFAYWIERRYYFDVVTCETDASVDAEFTPTSLH